MIILRWHDGGEKFNSTRSAVSISPSIQLPQFDYRGYKLFTKEFKLSTGYTYTQILYISSKFTKRIIQI